HPILYGLIAVDRFSCVLMSITDHGKAVVLALLNRIDFIAAARPVLAGPQLSRAWIDRHSLDVPETQRKNFGVRYRLAAQRVVLGNRSVGVDPKDLAHVAVQLLWLRPVDGIDAEARGDG